MENLNDWLDLYLSIIDFLSQLTVVFFMIECNVWAHISIVPLTIVTLFIDIYNKVCYTNNYGMKEGSDIAIS